MISMKEYLHKLQTCMVRMKYLGTYLASELNRKYTLKDRILTA